MSVALSAGCRECRLALVELLLQREVILLRDTRADREQGESEEEGRHGAESPGRAKHDAGSLRVRARPLKRQDRREGRGFCGVVRRPRGKSEARYTRAVLLERIRVVRVGPFPEATLDFVRDDGVVRPVTVLHGESGTGKSSLLAAIAATRPGRAVVVTNLRRRGDEAAHAVADWRLGAEEPERPHALRVASPSAPLGEGEEEVLRRREQAHFDRRANEGPGFALIEIPSDRTFPRGAIVLADPARTLLRWEVRGGLGSETTRPDLGRLVKQALAYAAISSSLAGDRTGHPGDVRALGAAMAEAIDATVQVMGHRYRGVEPSTLEPLFISPGGSPHLFDSLPTALKHVVAMIAVPMRALWAAHRGADPRRAEGVVLIDDAELHLTPRLAAALPDLLARALPSAQWILTTASYELAASVDATALVTLRHLPESDEVQTYVGELAITH